MDRPTQRPAERAPSGADGATDSLWRRLRRNASENGATLRAAGAREDRVGQARCPRCGTAENLLFWTQRRRSRDEIRFRCPYCERGEVRYGISRNRIYAPGERVGAVRAVSWTVIAVSCMVAAAVWFQGPEISRILGLAWNSSVDRVPVPAVREGIRLPVGDGATSRTGPIGGWLERLRIERRPTPAVQEVRFQAAGDRREEAQQLIAATGSTGAIRELRYTPGDGGAAGTTRLTIESDAGALVQALSQSTAWARVEEP